MKRLITLVLALSAIMTQPARTEPSSPATPPSAPAAPCSQPQQHEFDFWIGDWQVTGANGKIVGHNRIEPLLGGCVLREHWRNANGSVEGQSFNLYDGLLKQWLQFWVDNSGASLSLRGGLVDGRMVMSGERPNPATGKTQLQRITWTPNADGSVRQLWETSDDAGASWQTSFDGMYRKQH